jgi:glycine C-acetyltransferase
MLDQGVYVVAFSYPVVPKGAARIRTQMSASISVEELDFALNAFSKVKDKLL